MWIVLVHWDERRMYRTVEAKAEHARTLLNEGTAERVQALKRMSVRWKAAGDMPRRVWEVDAAQYVDNFPDMQVLGWMDPAGRMRWVVPRPGSERALGLDLNAEPGRLAIEQARSARDMVVSDSVPFGAGRSWNPHLHSAVRA